MRFNTTPTPGVWYPPSRRERLKKEGKVFCPVCFGSAKRIDAKTGLERPCVACKEGVVKSYRK